MAKRNVPKPDFPHLKTGRGQYPEKPANAKGCFFCGRRCRNGPLVTRSHTLCKVHDTPKLRRLVKSYVDSQTVEVKPRKRRPAVYHGKTQSENPS